MNPIASSKDMAAGNALVALYQIELVGGNQSLYTVCESKIAPGASKIKRCTMSLWKMRLHLPRACDQRDVYPAAAKGIERTLDNALSAAKWRICLPYDCKLHASREVTTADGVMMVV